MRAVGIKCGQDMQEERRTENGQGPRGSFEDVLLMFNPILPLLSLRNEPSQGTMALKWHFFATTRNPVVGTAVRPRSKSSLVICVSYVHHSQGFLSKNLLKSSLNVPLVASFMISSLLPTTFIHSAVWFSTFDQTS